MGRQTARRDQLIVQARAAGITYRRIALAVGMTEQGVRLIYERTQGK